jgi:hypothetical protein
MDFNNYIMQELLVLVPVLIIVGQFIKGLETVKNKYIPVILGLLGIAFAIAWTIIMSEDTNIPHAILTGVVQGILIAGAAVYGNQIFKQLKGGKEDE